VSRGNRSLLFHALLGLDAEALDLLVKGREGYVKLLSRFCLVPVGALQLVSDDAALDVFENVEERGVGIVFEQGIPLSSTRLKKVLGNFSGVPTHGSPYVSWISWPILTSIPLERFLDQAQQPWS